MQMLRSVVACLVCGVIALLVACSPSPAEIGAKVRSSMQQTFSTDPNFSKFEMKIVSVTVIKEAGNKYQGIATVITKKGAERQVPVQITAEGENVIWKTEPGAFLFVAQEELHDILSR